MAFVLSGILVFSDKVIDDQLSKKTKEWIAMTKVGRLFAEEAEQKVAKKVVEILEGNTCGMKPTSCADQLAKAIREVLDNEQ